MRFLKFINKHRHIKICRNRHEDVGINFFYKFLVYDILILINAIEDCENKNTSLNIYDGDKLIYIYIKG